MVAMVTHHCPVTHNLVVWYFSLNDTHLQWLSSGPSHNGTTSVVAMPTTLVTQKLRVPVSEASENKSHITKCNVIYSLYLLYCNTSTAQVIAF